MQISEILMWQFFVQIAILTIEIIVYILYTIVFCFWSIYLLDAMKRKRSFYKTTLRCIEGESEPHQQMLAYSAKTELVKIVSLFCLNFVEWVGLTFVCTFRILKFVLNHQHQFIAKNFLSVSDERNTSQHIPYFGIVCGVISMAIMGSLCKYLAARYAYKSWITSKRIPYWICFLLLSSIATQILVIIRYTHIIGIWCGVIVLSVSVIFAWKQYKQLDMVVQWSIVDMKVSGNIGLLEKHVRMKRRFNRIFTTIWMGVSFGLVTYYIDAISKTSHVLLLMYNHSNSRFDSYAFALVYWIEVSFTILAFIIFIFPYIGYGLCTMFVLLWRLFKGKTGYKTHFHVQLTTPLIQP